MEDEAYVVLQCDGERIVSGQVPRVLEKSNGDALAFRGIEIVAPPGSSMSGSIPYRGTPSLEMSRGVSLDQLGRGIRLILHDVVGASGDYAGLNVSEAVRPEPCSDSGNQPRER